jgi:hypothetical protein
MSGSEMRSVAALLVPSVVVILVAGVLFVGSGALYASVPNRIAPEGVPAGWMCAAAPSACEQLTTAQAAYAARPGDPGEAFDYEYAQQRFASSVGNAFLVPAIAAIVILIAGVLAGLRAVFSHKLHVPAVALLMPLSIGLLVLVTALSALAAALASSATGLAMAVLAFVAAVALFLGVTLLPGAPHPAIAREEWVLARLPPAARRSRVINRVASGVLLALVLTAVAMAIVIAGLPLGAIVVAGAAYGALSAGTTIAAAVRVARQRAATRRAMSA